jgi:hypothetical protein
MQWKFINCLINRIAGNAVKRRALHLPVRFSWNGNGPTNALNWIKKQLPGFQTHPK